MIKPTPYPRPDGEPDDVTLWQTFRRFLLVTPPELIAARPEVWPDLFSTRLEFEVWREQWLAFLLGAAWGPTTPEQYDRLRHRLLSGRGRRVDKFHSRPSAVTQ